MATKRRLEAEASRIKEKLRAGGRQVSGQPALITANENISTQYIFDYFTKKSKKGDG